MLNLQGVKIKKAVVLLRDGTDLITLTLDAISPLPDSRDEAVLNMECKQNNGVDYCRNVFGIDANVINTRLNDNYTDNEHDFFIEDEEEEEDDTLSHNEAGYITPIRASIERMQKAQYIILNNWGELSPKIDIYKKLKHHDVWKHDIWKYFSFSDLNDLWLYMDNIDDEILRDKGWI